MVFSLAVYVLYPCEILGRFFTFPNFACHCSGGITCMWWGFNKCCRREEKKQSLMVTRSSKKYWSLWRQKHRCPCPILCDKMNWGRKKTSTVTRSAVNQDYDRPGQLEYEPIGNAGDLWKYRTWLNGIKLGSWWKLDSQKTLEICSRFCWIFVSKRSLLLE